MKHRKRPAHGSSHLPFLLLAAAILAILCGAAYGAYQWLQPDAPHRPRSSDSGNPSPLDEQVEQILSSMSKTEKLGQMVMIGIQGTEMNEDIRYMLRQFHIGGIILFDRNMETKSQVQELIRTIQDEADEKVPLFIAIDEEGGDVVRMRHELVPPPAQEEIGSAGDPASARKWAVRTAKALKDMGINVNLAPVADIGSNDRRSYSSDPEVVTDFVRQAAQGYASENFLYCLKHFPGIGKGKVDSHAELSDIDASESTLAAEDFIPFQSIIQENTPENFFILVSHLRYPALDPDDPASLSPAIMTGILRKQMGYRGIIITDDLEMGAIANHEDFRSVGAKAVEAGADIVLVCHEYPHETDVYLGLLDALEKGDISEERIDESVRRILKAKLLHRQE